MSSSEEEEEPTEEFTGQNNSYIHSSLLEAVDSETDKSKQTIICTSIGIVLILSCIGIFIYFGFQRPEDDDPQVNPWQDNSFSLEQHQQEQERTWDYALTNRNLHPSINSIYSNHTNNLKQNNQAVLDGLPELTDLSFHLEAIDDHIFRFRITDNQNERWELPHFASSSGIDDWINAFQHYSLEELNVTITDQPDKPFWFSFTERNEQQPFFTTQDRRFKFFDHYIEFETFVQTNRIFGLGERVSDFKLKDGKYNIFNHAQYPESPTDNLFSSFPFYLAQLKNKKFIGVYLHNSNAQEITIDSTKKEGGTVITHKMCGGVIDMYVFHAAEPEYILKRFHHKIGHPNLPPFWALGYHQSRWGYSNNAKIKEILDEFEAEKIPMDSIGTDMDLMQNYKDFTLNEASYPDFANFVEESIHKKGKKFIPVVTSTFPQEKAGTSEFGFIKSAKTKGKKLVGETYENNKVVYWDFFSSEERKKFETELENYKTKLNLDGLYLTMNEIQNLCDGECSAETSELREAEDDTDKHDPLEFSSLPFTPGGIALNKTTVSMTGYHKAESDSEIYPSIKEEFLKEFNTHNLFGVMHARAVFDFLRKEGKRAFALSRSTGPSSGVYTAHWLGENQSTYQDMRLSIPSIFNFQLFAIPLVGANICGYYGEATPEKLCEKWIQLGALYPLSRNHNSPGANRQDPAAKKDFVDSAHGALVFRYSILRFYYTKIFETFLHGGTVVQPPCFLYPHDDKLFEDQHISQSFIIGETLLVLPSLTEEEHTLFYIPNDTWFNVRNWNVIVEKKEGIEGEEKDLAYSNSFIHVWLRAGKILVQQPVTIHNVRSTKDLEQMGISIIVAPDAEQKADGTMIADDGESIPRWGDYYRHYNFVYSKGIFKINLLGGFYYDQTFPYEMFSELKILNYNDELPTFVCYFDHEMSPHQLFKEIITEEKALRIYLNEETPNKEDLREIAIHEMESIVFGGVNDQNICEPGNILTSLTYENEKSLTGIIETTASLTTGKKMQYKLSSQIITDKIARITIELEKTNNWKVPGAINEGEIASMHDSTSQTFSNFKLKTSAPNSEFYFELGDEDSYILTTRYNPLIYKKDFIKLQTRIKTSRIFGIGERVHKFELDPGIYTMHARDVGSPEETAHPPGNNMYSVHPFYMFPLANPNQFAACFFLNSNAMDFQFKNAGNGIEMTHLFSGGIIDLFVIMKGNPEEIVREYHKLIGKPVLLPYWAFGNHQCKFGYQNQNELESVMDQYKQNQIPLEVMWTDIEYMVKYRDFTVDKTRYNLTTTFRDKLDQNHQKFVLILDAGIARQEDYDVYNEGIKNNLFLKSGKTNDPLIGIVWPGYAVYYDLMKEDASVVWQKNLNDLHKLSGFDGMWIDMNECSNFCDGECPDETHYKRETFPNGAYDNNVYIPGHRFLAEKTISMDAGEEPLNIQYNTHNIYGFLMGKATKNYFDEQNKRPFIISRSTYPGSGRYNSHWLGDNHSTWDSLKFSISGMYNSQMFGLTYSGADICGFFRPTEHEKWVPLCKRWIQVGAFYPFCRNHYGNGGGETDMEPYVDEKLIDVYKKALTLRFSLIRYFYTLYMEVVFEVKIDASFNNQNTIGWNVFQA